MHAIRLIDGLWSIHCLKKYFAIICYLNLNCKNYRAKFLKLNENALMKRINTVSQIKQKIIWKIMVQNSFRDCWVKQ